MRRFLLAASLTATVVLSASSVLAESPVGGCPSVDTEIRKCEANNMRYETYLDEMQCKRAKCIEPGFTCPSADEMEEQKLGCIAAGKTPEKFWNGVCNVVRCTEASKCPTEAQNNERIAKCKAAGMDYEYTETGSCFMVQCTGGMACPSNYELDKQALACKAKGGVPEYVNDGVCRRLNCTEGTCDEEAGYRTATWECHDGLVRDEGGDSSCKPSSTWLKYATDDCKGRCNRETGKCGLNSFVVDWECGGENACDNPSQTCPSMEDNERLAKACRAKGGTLAKTQDRNDCVRLSCEHAEDIPDSGDVCPVLRKRIDEVCTTKDVTEERCEAAKAAFKERCLGDADDKETDDACFRMSDVLDKEYADGEYSDDEKLAFYKTCFRGNNFRAEADACKEMRSKLARLKNAGLTETQDFRRLVSAFEEECTGEAAPVPVASFDEPVLDEEECGDYDNPYPDVDQCSPEGKAAVELYRRDIATGMPSGEFDGDEPLNRAQTAKFLLRACNLSEEEMSSRGAPDIDESQWYAPLIRAAMAHGVIQGNPDGTVRPGNTVNHAEFTAMLMRACGLEPAGWPVCAEDVEPEDWFAPGAAVAEAYDLYPDSGGMFNPGALQTREETAVAIYQYLKFRELGAYMEADDSCFLIPEVSEGTEDLGVSVE